MDTLHDLGGRQGFGPICRHNDDDSTPFHEAWEARACALGFIMFGRWRKDDSGANLDWFRHVRERIDPVDYLTRPYFDQWTQSIMAILIDEGTITLAELTELASKNRNVVAAKSASSETSIEVPESVVVDTPALFVPGDHVRTKTLANTPYTRLPGYIRGRTGVVEAYHGKQPLADLVAIGRSRKERLYTVAFRISELWPEAAGQRDLIFVDLWESYIEPPRQATERS